MRVLVLAPQPLAQTRGTPIAVKALIEALSSRGYGLEVLTYAESEDFDVPNCVIRHIPRIPGLRRPRPGFSLAKVVSDLVMLPIALWKIGSRRFDVVHAVEEAAFIAAIGALLFDVPYVYDMDSSLAQQMSEQFGFLTPLKWLLERAEGFIVRHSLAVVAVCPALVKIAHGYALKKPSTCVPDFSLIDPKATDAPPDDMPRSAPVVLYAGNLEPYQGIDLLLEAFALTLTSVPAAELVIIGGTPQHVARYQERAAGLGIAGQVHLLGPRPVATLGSYLEHATVVVSPRIRGLNTPMKIYSYLDSGTPLLATRLPTHTQVLDDDIAALADADPQSFGAALARLLEDPDLRSRIAAAAKQRVQRDFTREAFQRKMDDFYTMVEHELATVAAEKFA
jgi:glycosyltransferase involved in cell wall biosynthesis